MIGELTYKSSLGLFSSMSTGLVYQQDSLKINTMLQLSLKNSFASLSISRAFMNDNFKLKSSVRYGYTGVLFSYGIEKQLTQYSRVDASIIINSMSGVLLNLELVLFNFFSSNYFY